MKLTPKQQKELSVFRYFMPDKLKVVEITDSDLKKYFQWSERGMHKEEASSSGYKTEFDGFAALIQGKRWAGIHMHELWEPGVLDGSIPYYCLLGGEDGVILPREVVDFMKHEMFKGIDTEVIENCYQEILKEYK